VDTTLGEAEILEIWETGEEKELSIGQLKYKYLQFVKQNFQGKVFTNNDSGKPIRVSADGIMEWWRKSRRREHIIAVQALDSFLENAMFIDESPDYQERKKIESASKFETECKVDGKPYRVIVITRKARYDVDKFRYFSLKDRGLVQPQKKP
jgi:hypothetical protein